MSVLGMETASRQGAGAQNFEVLPMFFKYFWTPESEFLVCSTYFFLK